MDLKLLGWDGSFEESYHELGLENTEGILIGRVIRWDGSKCLTESKEGDIIASVSGRVSKGGSPAVGDWVVIKRTDLADIIIEILERKTTLSRKVPGDVTREQVIAANLDLVFIMMGLDSDYNPRRLERYLVMVSGSGAKPVILLNKSDLGDPEKIKEITDLAPGVPVHAISALKGDGLDVIREYLQEGVTISLVGSSGVGKSTLINRLLKSRKQVTREVRKKDGKGRHTTTSRELIPIPGGGLIIDNPGIREIQLWIDSDQLNLAFNDISELSLSCRFKDCQHISEPDCAVLKALKDGILDERRYENYLKMRKEIRNIETRKDIGSRVEKKRKWKNLTKDIKHYYRYKKKGY
mgnify:CR=1 FL=1